ncbi:MAG: pentapeptide repeat-containing protein [bacterium]
MLFDFKKGYLLLVFCFIQLTSFAMHNELQPQVHYDEVAFERLKAFSNGENPEVNHFANENLRGIRLDGTVIKNAIFNNDRFDHSRFINFSLEDASKILNSNLKSTVFGDAFFYDSDIKNSKFIETKIWNSIFNNFVILDSDFSESNFLNCRFANMRIDSKNSKKCFVSGNKFNSSLFKSCTFKWVGFKDNDFSRVRIENSSFKKCFIVGVDFSRTSLKDVIFEKCVFVDCKSLDKMYFTGNVVFNFCEFVKTDGDKEYAEKLVHTIKNLGANVLKKPGKWKEFKQIAGAMVGIASHVGSTFLSAGVSEYARSILSDCNRACTVWLNDNE